MRRRVAGTVLLATLVALAAAGASSTSSALAAGASSSAKSANQVTIIGLFPLTGPNASYGTFQVNGSKMAVDEINAKGGIGGKTKINYKIEDTQVVPEKAVLAFNQLYSSSKPVFALTVGSSQTMALLPIARKDHVVLLNGGAQGDELGGKSMLFNDIPLIGTEVQVLAPYLYKKKHYRRAAMIYNNDDLGKAAAADFRRMFQAQGGKIVASASADPNSTDDRSQLTTLRASNPDVLFIGSYGGDAKTMIDQARQLGWKVQLAGTSLLAFPDVLKDSNAKGLLHTVIPYHPTKSFVARYRKRYGTAPNHPFISNYYDGVEIFAKAYAYAVAHHWGTTGTAVARAIDKIKTFPSSFGGTLTFKKGVAMRPIDIAVMNGSGKDRIIAKNYH